MLKQLKEMYENLEKNKVSVSDVCSAELLQEVSQVLNLEKTKLKSYRTASLWLQYMDMVSVLQQFIRAERVSDWIGHLQATKRMLPYFAASGHYLYLKSAYIYLQNMINLEREHPDVFRQFMDGKHTVRRSDRYWAGLSTDLVIEQVLMRSLKSNGGLTRGRGISEHQRVLWSLAMPATAEMNAAMQLFTGQEYQTSDQHKEIGHSRRARDGSDTKLLLNFLRDHSPFEKTDGSFRNIETGVTADEKVNADKAVEIGCKIIQNMTDVKDNCFLILLQMHFAFKKYLKF
ncbi:uncharacterized protein LOC123538319 isoform X1 [Mercenaria mercenaria]|uniref:uncharacterized protein LOC123538319 isoform X1 n=1 Tax=Mercenaria mercenaria TaxID=6596 RepID=UPI00234F4E1E|nr:uncharacterized protein LOC123538319 isoform X1 [Mercenaria mercenaria]